MPQTSARARALALVAIGLMANPAWGQPRPEPTPAQVDALFAPWDKPGSPGCSVAVSRNGRLLYQRGYGLADVENGAPISPDTGMGAASIAKQFTAMSILLLAQRGKLSIDDPVGKYIAGWATPQDHVTLRHLLAHTSGLREGFGLLGLANQSPWEDNNEALARALARQTGASRRRWCAIRTRSWPSPCCATTTPSTSTA